MKSIFFLFLSGLVLLSCEKVMLQKDQSSRDPFDNFDYLWRECNEKYAYFDLKNVDWDQVRAEYFARLYDGMSDDSLFSVLGGMLSELRDDHANLFSDFNVSFYGVEYQSQDNFDWRLIVDHYIGPDFYLSGPLAHNFLENGQLGYIRLNSFAENLSEANLDFVLDRYRDTQGLVLDLRENGGGAIANVFKLLRRFVESNTLVNYSVIKSGPGPNDFSDPEPVMVEPYQGIRYAKPIAVLTDRGSYSSSSLFALACKALPQISLIGDSTGGGLGMPNGGQLPNGWTYRFSVSQALDLELKPDLENGVDPDISINIDWNIRNRDEILDRAIAKLL